MTNMLNFTQRKTKQNFHPINSQQKNENDYFCHSCEEIVKLHPKPPVRCRQCSKGCIENVNKSLLPVGQQQSEERIIQPPFDRTDQTNLSLLVNQYGVIVTANEVENKAQLAVSKIKTRFPSREATSDITDPQVSLQHYYGTVFHGHINIYDSYYFCHRLKFDFSVLFAWRTIFWNNTSQYSVKKNLHKLLLCHVTTHFMPNVFINGYQKNRAVQLVDNQLVNIDRRHKYSRILYFCSLINKITKLKTGEFWQNIIKSFSQGFMLTDFLFQMFQMRSCSMFLHSSVQLVHDFMCVKISKRISREELSFI